MPYSVLMSVYDKEDKNNFRAAVDSMINQTAAPDDIVIVCDGPLTKELDEAVEYYEKTYESLFTVLRLEKNMGLGVALHKGLLKCRNEIVARMDADDISVPERMEKELAVIENNPSISVVGGQIAEFCESAENIVSYRKVPTDENEIARMMKSRNPLNHVTTVFRKSDVIAVGNYSDLNGFEDYCLWARLYASGKRLCNIDDVCCFVRVDKNTYHRRSGIEYFKKTVEMEKILRSSGIISSAQMAKNLTVRFVGTVLMPNDIRGALFRRLMRRKQL